MERPPTSTSPWFSSYSSGSSAYVTYYVPSNLKTVILTDETVLGYGAFYGCGGLMSIAIPNSVTSIATTAFDGCNGIRSVAIPDSVCNSGLSTVFPLAYQAITDVEINEGVSSLGDLAFAPLL